MLILSSALIIIIFLLLIIFFLKKNIGAANYSADEKLKEKYIEVSGLPPGPALEALRRRVEALEEKYPLRKDSWYIEKALFEIERDRGR